MHANTGGAWKRIDAWLDARSAEIEAELLAAEPTHKRAKISTLLYVKLEAMQRAADEFELKRMQNAAFAAQFLDG